MANKKFVVRVVRICPQYLRVEVEAASEKEAEKKALVEAPNRDFYEGTAGTADYRVLEVDEVED